jgi:hypothetical protein
MLLIYFCDWQIDFRCGWNALVIGFSGVWHYVNITDFEYNYRIYTPLEGFEENGILAKLIYKDGLDFAVGIVLSDIKVICYSVSFRKCFYPFSCLNRLLYFLFT